MNIEKVSLVYFSPTGNVCKTIRKISQGINAPAREIDLTGFDSRWQNYTFSENELVVIGLPVYNGRIPENSTEFFRTLKPDNTMAVTFVSYGNDDYGDALMELNNSCKQRGFFCIASAAFIGSHAQASGVAASRPDEADASAAVKFGRQAMQKAVSLENADGSMVSVPGNYPYRFRSEIHLAPVTDESCSGCGKCAEECPVCAINPATPTEIDVRRCIRCFRCIHGCPVKAKRMNDDSFCGNIALLQDSCKRFKEPEFFI